MGRDEKCLAPTSEKCFTPAGERPSTRPDNSRQCRRRSIRLRGFDYGGEGAYFLTVCTWQRACLFGDVIDGCMHLNDIGRIAESCWLAISSHFPHAELDTFVIMPNHVHGIVWITDTVGAKNVSPIGANDHSPLPDPAFRSPSKTVGSIVRGFKIGVTKWIRTNTDIHQVWQRNYYEHIIRNDAALDRIRRYIIENPARWADDAENPDVAVVGEKFFAHRGE